MQSQSVKNNTQNKIHITRENLFVGLSFPERVESCIEMVEGRANQFINETSILLDLARSEASVYVCCEAENDTDICANLAQFDIEVKDLAEHTKGKLREL